MNYCSLANDRLRHRAAFSAVALVLLVGACASGRTSNPNYRLDVLAQPVAVGAHSEFDVRLTRVSTGQPVSDAVISSSTLEMTHHHPVHKGSLPTAMNLPMTTEVKPLGTPGPGLYRFMGDFSMPGTWKLSVTASIPGETEPVISTTTVEAGR